MHKLLIISDFTESFPHKLLKGIMRYTRDTKPWAIIRMPPEYKKKFGIEGVFNHTSLTHRERRVLADSVIHKLVNILKQIYV